jgi:Tol biopolymer transport system component
MTERLLTITLLALAAISPALPQRGGAAEAQFQAAQHKEQVEGDLRTAIQLYQKVADSKDSSRAIAAQALLRVGSCYETLGSAEARKAYERVLRQYSDQPQFVSEARSRLAAAEKAGSGFSGLAARLVGKVSEYPGPYDQWENVATDGRTVFHVTEEAVGENSLIATDLSTRQQRTLFQGNFLARGLHLSPDGRRLAFCHYDLRPRSAGGDPANWSIYTVGVDGSNPRSLQLGTKPGTQRIGVVFHGWSPDGKELLFSTATDGNIEVLDADRTFQLKLLSVTDGSVRLWKDFGPRDTLRRISTVSFSPDGRYLAYTFPDERNPERKAIYILGRETSEPSLLAAGPGNSMVLSWTPDGKDLLFASDRRGAVDAYRIAVTGGKAAGAPALAKADIGAVRPLGFRSNGSFYYMNEALTRAILTADIDPATGKITGKPQVVTERFVEEAFIPKWSPDGTMLVYATRNNLARTAKRLTFRTMATGQDHDVPLGTVVGSIRIGSEWSPDSKFLYVDGFTPDGRTATFRVDPRSDEVKQIAPGICHQPLPDGKLLLCFERQPNVITLNLARFDLATGAKAFLKAVDWAAAARPLSPDGRYLAYMAKDGEAVRLVPLGEGEERELIRARTGERVMPISWLGNDTVAFMRVEGGKVTFWLANVQTKATTAIDAGSLPHVKFENFPFMRFHPSGRQIVFVSDEGQNELWALDNIIPAQHASTTK